MLFNYMFLFMVGSIGGYFLELFYRKIINNKWIKPGVFKGIYLPLYGMGLCICYFSYNLDTNIIFKLLLCVSLLTFIELLCGVIFIKFFNIPLWDYSNNKYNYKGLVCLKFSLYWGLLGLICIKVFFEYINLEIFCVRSIVIFMFIFYGIFVCDVLYKLFCLFYSKIVK